MTNFALVREPVNLLRDIIWVMIYVHFIEDNQMREWWRRCAATVLLFVFAFMIWRIGSFASAVTPLAIWEMWPDAFVVLIRFILRMIGYILYVSIRKGVSFSVAVYDSLLISTVLLIVHNLFLTPLTKPVLDASIQLMPGVIANQVFCMVVLNLVCVIFYALAVKYIPLHSTRTETHTGILLLIVALISWYLNGTIKMLENIATIHLAQTSVYILLVQILLLVCIYYVERFQRMEQITKRIMLESQSVRYILESVEQQRANDELLQHVRHDLKNHLISLNYLIKSGKEKEALSYMDKLIADMASPAKVMSGNHVLDAILSQKLSIAERHNICVSVFADFSFLSFIGDVDLCVLFGNLLDNALEACQKVNAEDRFIRVRANQIGDSVLYSIENSCSNNVVFDGNTPLTSKENKDVHGIGIASVRRVVGKYHGNIAFSEKDGTFVAAFSFHIS